MRPKRIEVTMDALDRNGVCTAQQLAAAGDLVLDGALSAGYDRNGVSVAQTPTAAGDLTITGALASGGVAHLGVERRLLVYSDGNDSGVTFTVYGRNRRGDQVYETITGPNATFAFSTNNYYEVTRVAISAAGTGSIEVGSVGVATTDVPRHVGAYCAGDINTVTFTVVGLDRFGNAVSEEITGVNASTVSGAINFSSITKISSDAAVGTNVEIGTVDSLESQWIPTPQTGDDVGVGVTLSTGASMTYSVHYTYDDVQAEDFQENDAAYFDASSNLTDATTDQDGSATSPVAAMRLEVTSFVSGTAKTTVMSPH